MMKTSDMRWSKAYVGPFKKKEAKSMVTYFRDIADPENNLIVWANIRKRRNSKMFDGYIKKLTQ